MDRDSPVVIKPWGRYEVIHEAKNRLVKLLYVEPRQSLSLQSHQQRAEHWFVLEGIAKVEVNDRTRHLKQYDTIEIPVRARHRLSNKGRGTLCVLEVQYGEQIDERDIFRHTDRYGRALGNLMTKETTILTPPVIICEIGCNHRGDIDTALEMIKMAAQFCKVDVIKFQKRCVRELLTTEEYDAQHPNPVHSYGPTYGEHRDVLEFPAEQHKVLKQACEEWGVTYSTSVWDVTSAREIVALKPQMLKIPSAINTDFQVLDYLCSDFEGEIHISLGMTTRHEELEIVDLLHHRRRMEDTVLYHCISGYPVEDSELHLLEINRLLDAYKDVKGIGFSGHHKGIASDIAALTLGATYFERHFTLDRTWKGTDHAASLEPDGMRRVARDLRKVRTALSHKPTEILAIEEVQREKLKRYAKLLQTFNSEPQVSD